MLVQVIASVLAWWNHPSDCPLASTPVGCPPNQSTISASLAAVTCSLQELGGTPSQFGIVIAAFALTKLLGNIPAAYLVVRALLPTDGSNLRWPQVDRHGRRPYLMYSLLVIGQWPARAARPSTILF